MKLTMHSLIHFVHYLNICTYKHVISW